MQDLIDAFPLCWPFGYERAEAEKRTVSRFKQTMDESQKFLHKEIDRLGGIKVIVSTNIPVRKDGMLYSEWMNRKIEDPGVAVYFEYKGNQVALCCDRYLRIWENIYAIGRTIEALRQISRDGVSDFLNRTFTGFKQIAETTATSTTCWDVLGIQPTKDRIKIMDVYRSAAKSVHPDVGGTPEDFDRINKAYKQALQYADSK